MTTPSRSTSVVMSTMAVGDHAHLRRDLGPDGIDAVAVAVAVDVRLADELREQVPHLVHRLTMAPGANAGYVDLDGHRRRSTIAWHGVPAHRYDRDMTRNLLNT